MPGIITGLEENYYAILSKDEEGSILYDVPERLYDIQQIQVSPEVQSMDVPGDNRTVETITQCLGAGVTVQWAKQKSSERAIFLGEKVLSNGIKAAGETDDPPYVAIGYKRTMTGGVTRYVWLLKTKFGHTQETADTKPVGSIQPQYPTISGKAITRNADGQWKFQIDSNDPDYTEALGANWFTKATLETLANVASTTYGKPAKVEFVTTLPATGIAGVVYIDTDAEPISAHYWDGSAFVAIE